MHSTVSSNVTSSAGTRSVFVESVAVKGELGKEKYESSELIRKEREGEEEKKKKTD